MLHLDCANGVGYPSFLEFLKFINEKEEKLQVVFNNHDEPDRLNEDCGAEFVHKQKKLPLKLQVQPYVHCASFDGDADRLVYYFVDEANTLHLIDGDRQSVIMITYIRKLLSKLSIEKELSLACIQTAYVNGANMDYLKNNHIQSIIVPTGVKNLHKEAVKYDIAIYFESNGHGSLYYSPKTVSILEQQSEPEAKKLLDFLQLANQQAGDSMVNILMIEVALQELNMSLKETMNFYTDYPNVTEKIVVKDKSKIKNTWNHSKVTEPKEIQDFIDSLVTRYEKARAFIRPSGTEDIVRLYAECQHSADLSLIASEIRHTVETNKYIN